MVGTLPRLRLAYLYPRLMNLYSDFGNVECLRKRCEWRGIELEVVGIEAGEDADFGRFDMAFIGGGEDRQQVIAARDLVLSKGPALRDALAGGLVCLAVCGGFQLLAESYRPAEGEVLPGIGHFRAHTIHAGARATRRVGNVVASWASDDYGPAATAPRSRLGGRLGGVLDQVGRLGGGRGWPAVAALSLLHRARSGRFGQVDRASVGSSPGGGEDDGGLLVGFENHGGATYLTGSLPLGRVLVGHGNNGEDGTEGAIEGNAIGTYLHGSVLPKNPRLADWLLERSLHRRGVVEPLPPLEDGAEWQARAALLRKMHVPRTG